ncbi:Imm1 family immunity protein [Actinopolyspora mortivallis]|uniref:Imm1 family immunity protein n=1 Tax=Actinopolyspora mortivallis TaxID=33906 RepID=UPI0009FEAD97|nr:Imm1 family immunity protein [Actinopolyspora mortivallis]
MVLNVSVANREFKQAESGERTEALVEELLSTDHGSWESHISFTQEAVDPDEVDEDWYPDHDVTLAVDPREGYGAIRCVDMAEDGELCVTPNPDEEPAVDLLTDGGTPHFFPRSAVLPVGEIRKALREFSRTGRRPECVK